MVSFFFWFSVFRALHPGGLGGAAEANGDGEDQGQALESDDEQGLEARKLGDYAQRQWCARRRWGDENSTVGRVLEREGALSDGGKDSKRLTETQRQQLMALIAEEVAYKGGAGGGRRSLLPWVKNAPDDPQARVYALTAVLCGEEERAEGTEGAEGDSMDGVLKGRTMGAVGGGGGGAEAPRCFNGYKCGGPPPGRTQRGASHEARGRCWTPPEQADDKRQVPDFCWSRRSTLCFRRDNRLTQLQQDEGGVPQAAGPGPVLEQEEKEKKKAKNKKT
jgi:hypothetical protein